MSSVVARGSLCKLINTIYKWGGEAREAELGACGDTQTVEKSYKQHESRMCPGQTGVFTRLLNLPGQKEQMWDDQLGGLC